MPSFNKKIRPKKVPQPKAKPSVSRLFPRMNEPKLPGLQSRVYTKSILRQDPTEFSDFGFGDTGVIK